MIYNFILRLKPSLLVDEDNEKFTAEEIKSAETFMRLNPLDDVAKTNGNRDEMLRLFKVTRRSRRDFINSKEKSVTSTVIMNRYPRLKDFPEAVCICSRKI